MGPLFVAEGVSLGDLRYATRVKLAEQQRRPSFVVELRRGLRYATRGQVGVATESILVYAYILI
jgi:hypothetical protein